eukprot:80710-Prymnesium_polylepis.1
MPSAMPASSMACVLKSLRMLTICAILCFSSSSSARARSTTAPCFSARSTCLCTTCAMLFDDHGRQARRHPPRVNTV